VTTNDPARAHVLAGELDDSNRQRQEIEQRMVADALAEIDSRFDPARDFGIAVGRQGWHKGVVGIVASRIVARCRRPAVVVAFDDHGVGRGSCRSIDGFNLIEALDACAEHLDAHGGHAMAAGLTVSQDHFGAFQRAFDAACRERLSGKDLRPVVRIDGWLDYDEADERLMAGIDSLKPFGTGHPRPVWALRSLRVIGPPRLVGKSHLKLLLAGGGTQWEGIAFGMGDRDVPDGPLDVAFNLQRNSYQGRETLQLSVQDFRPSES
jgi:single-stranded-DNA-specific exonuclease